MKLIELNLTGFGKLVRRSFQFSPGLNLIFGQNEAGKSTMQRAILAMLYGFFGEGNVGRAMRDALSALAPWERDADYAGKLLYELDDGERYEVQRIFEPRPQTTLIHTRQKKDISKEFPGGNYGRLFFADEQLGMKVSVFENTCYVRQAELVSLDKNAGTITDTLLRLSANASNEATTREALATLDSVLKEQIGGAQARIKPLPVAQSRLGKLESEREQARQNRQTLITRNLALNRLIEDLERQENEIERLRYLQLLAERELVEGQQKAVEDSAKEVSRLEDEVDALKNWASFPIQSETVVNDLNARRKHQVQNAERSRQLAHGAVARLKSWEQELTAFLEELALETGSETPNLFPLETVELTVGRVPDIKRWIETQISTVHDLLEAVQKRLELDRNELAGYFAIGRGELARQRQALREARLNLEREKTSLDKAEQAWGQVGMDEKEWEKLSIELTGEVQRWQSWANFPVHHRDSILRLANRRTDMLENIQAIEKNVGANQVELQTLATHVGEAEGRARELASWKDLDDSQFPELQGLAAQLRGLAEVQKNAQNRLKSAQAELEETRSGHQGEPRAGDQMNISLTELMALQQRWLLARQRATEAQARLAEAQVEWGQVGMPVSEYLTLEKTVQEIQLGERPAPKPRKGCRALLIPWTKATPIDSTPTEITIYNQLHPIHTRLAQNQAEAEKVSTELKATEDEARRVLGLPMGSEILEEQFTAAFHRVQEYQQAAAAIAQQRRLIEGLSSEAKLASERYQETYLRLRARLEALGFPVDDLEKSISAYWKACEKKRGLERLETEIQRLRERATTLEMPSKKLVEARSALQSLELSLVAELQIARIEVEVSSLDAGLKQFESGVENYRRWQVARGKEQEARTRVEQHLNILLQARQAASGAVQAYEQTRSEISKQINADESEGVDEAYLLNIERQLEAIENRNAKLLDKQHRFERLENQLQEVNRSQNEWQHTEHVQQGIEAELCTVLKNASIDILPTELETGLAAFAENLRLARRWQKVSDEHALAFKQHNSLSENLEETVENRLELERRLAESQQKHPEWKTLTPKDSPQVYETAIQKAQVEERKTREEKLRLEGELKRLESSFRHLAEIDEELYVVRGEVQRLQFFQKCLELARAELDTATQEFQKQFAPRLEELMSEGLRRTTRQRYSSVRVDPSNLAVSIASPERQDWVGTESLSTGTRDLIYLTLRLSIARLMSRSGEKLPLLLDDPLVQCDLARQMQALEYLHTLAEENQILLFTKDQHTREWFEATCTKHPANRMITL